MPNLDNHMDELFKRAAENYPLKTHAGNFDDLLPFVAGKATTVAKPAAHLNKRITPLLFLLFLITAATITTYLVNNTNNKKHANNKTISQKMQSKPVQNNSNAEQGNKINQSITDNVTSISELSANANETIFQKKWPAYNTISKTHTNIIQPDAVTDETEIEVKDDVFLKELSLNKTNVEIEKEQKDKTSSITTVAAKKENNDKPENKREMIEEETKPTLKKNKVKPVFYYGVAAGIELNKVKSQNMTKAGFNGAIVLGLQVNKKLAVETGVQLSQKKYYSDGKYFKPKAGSMPVNMTINSLESTSTIIEIPISVKYNFSKKKNALYGKAGVSSYIITKENNKYQAVVSGQQQEVNSIYNSNKGYLASDVRVSAGYQHVVNKKLNMRIEPYIQLPLKGLGVGAMPVTTAGLQIVLTRN